MSHEIHKHDVLGFTGSRNNIWHRMGVEIPEGLFATEAFPRIGLGWDTELAPIFAELPQGEDENGNPILVRIPLPEHKAHIRMDELLPLGVVSDGYQQITNEDLAKFVDRIAGEDAAVQVASAGSLYNGRRVYCAVKLPKVIQVGADINETYVVVSNGHGGFASFQVYPSSIRPICDNTLRWSERDLSKGIVFRHTGDMEEKIKQARAALGLALREVDVFEQQVQALAATKLSAGQVRDFMLMAYDATFGALPDKDKDPEAFEKLSAKREKVTARWLENLEDERQQVAGIEGTAWQALNAVTQWHDHERGRYKDIATSGARFHSNLFGASNRDKQKALRTALALT